MARNPPKGRHLNWREGTDNDALRELLWPGAASKEIETAVRGAEEELTRRGLPTHPLLLLSKSRGEWLPAPEVPLQDVEEGLTLDLYMLQAGFRTIDAEHFAARVIVVANELRRAEGVAATALAFELGALRTIWRVYATERPDRQRGGGKEKRARWAEELALQISSWSDIPDENEPLSMVPDAGGEWVIYRHIDPKKGEVVSCAIYDREGHRVQSLTRESFRRHYFSKSGRKRRTATQ